MDTVKLLTAVVDTNVLLVSISSRSKYHWLYQAIISGIFNLAVTQEILIEYEEMIDKHWNSAVAGDVIRSLIELPNLHFTTIYYNLNLIDADPDDNKFVDCAFAANADYIVTHDGHFKILEKLNFPRIPTIDSVSFQKILNEKGLIQ